MLNGFREMKKVILSIEKERQNWQTSLKRKRLSYKLAPATLPKISDGDFGFLKQICPILKVFLDETLKFSKEISTASQIIPTYTMLKKFLTDQTTANTSSSQNIAKFIEKLLDGLTGRLSALSDKRILFYGLRLRMWVCLQDLLSLGGKDTDVAALSYGRGDDRGGYFHHL